MVHGVETDNNQSLTNMQYIRTGSSSRDKALTDLGTFVIGSEGIPMTGTSMIIGELWVAYQVKLSRAQLNQGKSILSQSTQWSQTATTAIVPSGATFTNNSFNNLNCTFTNVSASAFTITFPPEVQTGSFNIQVYCQGSGNNSNYFLGTSSPKLATVAYTSPQPTAAATGTLRFGLDTVLQINAPDRTQAAVNIVLNGATTVASLFWVYISQVNPQVFTT